MIMKIKPMQLPQGLHGFIKNLLRKFAMSTHSIANERVRFLFDELPIRGIHVQLDSVWQHIRSQKKYPKAIESALGELLAAGVLLSSNLKFDGDLILQVQGKADLSLLVVETTSDGTCRATARWNEKAIIADDADLTSLVGEGGMFVMTIQPKDGEAWQGVVALEGNSIADMLSNYMKRSEQLDTFIQLSTSDHVAAGLLLQRLPEEDFEQDDWNTVIALAQTTQSTELASLPAEDLLYRLFHEYAVRILATDAVEFACTCSEAKVSNMLVLIGGEEVGKIIEEEGSIEVGCDFCQQKYVFDEGDVESIFGMNVVEAVRKQHS